MHTPEPWFIHNLNGKMPNVMRRKMPHGEADTFFTSIHGPDKMRLVELDWGYGRKADEANAIRIVESVNALAGIAEPLKLRAALEELRAAYFAKEAALFQVRIDSAIEKLCAMLPKENADGQ